MALDIVEKSNKNSFVIFSDSLSCLQSIQHFNIHDTRVLSLVEKLNRMCDQKEIILAWVPSHVGIEGNEKADELAKQSLSLRQVRRHKIPHTDFKPAISKALKNEWETYWASQTGNKLNGIMPAQKRRKKYNLPRCHTTLLSRLRIGHTHYTHAFLLHGEPPPFCVGCNEDMSVKHILIKCLDFAEVRKKYFRVKTIKQLFDIVEPLKIVNYVKEIGLLGRL